MQIVLPVAALAVTILGVITVLVLARENHRLREHNAQLAADLAVVIGHPSAAPAPAPRPKLALVIGGAA